MIDRNPYVAQRHSSTAGSLLIEESSGIASDFHIDRVAVDCAGRVSAAVFSHGRAYRYLLWRQWSELPTINFVCLNPSTADAMRNDPTVERLERRARTTGYGRLIVTNIFAFRATDPKVMRAHPEPIGASNDMAIVEAAKQSDTVVCAWGRHGEHLGRGEAVRKLLNFMPLHKLKLTKDGIPSHPLYIGYDVLPTPWSQL